MAVLLPRDAWFFACKVGSLVWWFELISFVFMLILWWFSLGCSAIMFLASYDNYPGGYALKALHRIGRLFFDKLFFTYLFFRICLPIFLQPLYLSFKYFFCRCFSRICAPLIQKCLWTSRSTNTLNNSSTGDGIGVFTC